MMHRLSILVVCLFGCCALFAQSTCKVDTTDVYRPKIAEFGVEMLRDYHTATYSEDVNHAENEVDADRLFKAKLAIPFALNDRYAAGAQLKYYQHRFFFDEEDYLDDNGLYTHLNNATFTAMGARLFYQRNLPQDSKLKLIGGAEVRSDEFRWTQNTTKYFISGIYTRQVSDRTKIGTGFMLNQVMRVTSFYPLFIYERSLNSKWYLELNLPKSASLRRKLNSSNYLVGTTQFRGWRYNLSNSIEGLPSDLTLRKADLEASLAWEHELHDWLWLQASIGYTKNLRYYLVEPGGRNRDALLRIRARDASYAKLSIFIVPPRSLYK